MNKRSCIFHIPYALEPDAKPSAPQIRPLRLIDAFSEIGFEVFEISGSSARRKRLINVLLEQMRSGATYDFIYSESATIPTLVTDDDHFPHGGLTDYRLFRECQKRGITSGLFYRDIYWKFPEFDRQYGQLRSYGMKMLYKLDLRVYRKYIDTLFVPSAGFAEFVDTHVRPSMQKMACLPPGCEESTVRARAGSSADDEINILYVGGISGEGMYDMRELFAAVRSLDFVNLTVCVREKEWHAVKSSYEPFMHTNTMVVHKSGKELEALYERADVGALLFHPNQYRTFAMPFKVFEYLGVGLPMIASRGTSVGDMVEKGEWGWSCDFGSSSIQDLLHRLHENKKAIRESARKCLSSRQDNTWTQRAKQVCRQLGVSYDG